MFSLETERLVIREMTQNDFDAYFRICHQPEVHPYVPHISDNRDIEYGRFVSYIQMVYGFYGFGLWGIFLKEQDILIGQAGIESQIVDENGEIMLSYFLGNNFRSMGYAQEACGKILEYAREELEFDRIVAVIAPDNLPSIRLAVSLGFRRAKERVYQKKTGDLYVWQEHTAS